MNSSTHGPAYHFAPLRNWMNDPNGLVFHDGVYHLYFQANPDGPEHGNLSWGHATSTDLLTWTQHPTAIWFDEQAQIFSGSAVVDHGNTSGFGTADDPALVACYTAAAPGHQAQHLAVSTDAGQSFTKYAHNPVVDRNSADFRDPKVIRYQGQDGDFWVMVAVEAMDRQVVFHRSDDLVNWTYLSSYGPAGPVGGVWECPDLFPLPIDGNGDDLAWVLVISMNPGGVAGGSGTHYVVGDFDGQQFTPHTPLPSQTIEQAQSVRQDRAEIEPYGWIDFGRDCYAGVTFDGLPVEQRTLIAWLQNWDYAGQIPADRQLGRRSAMTLPRRLSLTRLGGQLVLVQQPVTPPLASASTDTSVPRAGRLQITDDGSGYLLSLADGAVEIRRDAAGLSLTRRGLDAWPDTFDGEQSMSLASGAGVLDLWVDVINDEHSSIEIFADAGVRVLTALVPALHRHPWQLTALDGGASTATVTSQPVMGGFSEAGGIPSRDDLATRGGVVD